MEEWGCSHISNKTNLNGQNRGEIVGKMQEERGVELGGEGVNEVEGRGRKVAGRNNSPTQVIAGGPNSSCASNMSMLLVYRHGGTPVKREGAAGPLSRAGVAGGLEFRYASNMPTLLAYHLLRTPAT